MPSNLSGLFSYMSLLPLSSPLIPVDSVMRTVVQHLHH